MPATLCVYAVVPGGASRGARRVTLRVPGTGVAGEPLRVCGAGAVAAIVGTHRRKVRATEANLREHDRILGRLLDRFPSVLPVRFGTYVEDQAALVLLLEAQQAPLRRALARLRHRVQMNVRLPAAAGTDAAGSPRHPRRQAAMSGTDYLRQQAAAQRAHELGGLRPAIERWVRMEKVERRVDVVSVYHLIPRRAARAYRAALERAAAGQNVRVLVTGPWPPYAFG